MKYYIEGILEESPYKIKATKTKLQTEKLLKVQEYAINLDKEKRSIFHNYARKEMFYAIENYYI